MNIKEITFKQPPHSGTYEEGLRYVFIGSERIGKIKSTPFRERFEFTPMQCNFLQRCSGSEDFIKASIIEDTKNMAHLYFNF